MILGSTLLKTFSTAKPLDGSSLNSSVAPAAVVYNNGAAIAPGAPPAIVNIAAGEYTLSYALTAANGHANLDWVQITVQVVLDGITLVRPVWEGCIAYPAIEAALVFNRTIYPMFTTHQPSTGANQAPDNAGVPTITVYRNQVATGIVPVLLNPATGIYLVTLPLTAGAGWAMGDVVDVEAVATIDGITKTSWVFTGGTVSTYPIVPEMIRGAIKRGIAL